MTHNEFIPHASIVLTNSGGIEIMLHSSCDGLYYRFNYGQDIEQEKIFEAEIEYKEIEGEEGVQPGFNHKGYFYSLNEFIKH